MNRWDIINQLIKKHNYKSYLEIGYFKGWSFDQINCEDKTAVDPNPSKTAYQEQLEYGKADRSVGGRLYKVRSDEFFEVGDPKSGIKYDIIFIDGLHEANQVYRDIENSLKHLNPEGTIVIHDCNPPTHEHTTTGDAGGNWNGNVYKAVVLFRAYHPQYEFYTIDTDWGTGILREREKVYPEGEEPFVTVDTNEIVRPIEAEYYIKDWEFFDQNRKRALNLISVEEFQNKMNETVPDNHLPA